MRSSAATLFTLLLLAACGGAEDSASAADEAAEAAPEMAEAPAISLADFAGTWTFMTTMEGTEDPVPSTIIGSEDGSEWSMTLEGRDPVPMTASMSGDSIVLVSDAFESILREGVIVTVRSAVVPTDGGLAGNMTATYQTPEGEEVVTGSTTGTLAEGM